MNKTSIERFWSKVNKNGPTMPNMKTCCWVWTGWKLKRKWNYGRFDLLPERKNRGAHQVSWELSNGPIPVGLSVCHHCDNPPCVRPDHLWLGTHQQNLQDRDAKGRQARGINSGAALHPDRIARGERNGKKTKPECTPRGERCSHKLAENEVREIRRLASNGIPARLLGPRYGVTRQCVTLILKGKNWRHVA
jgi:hypothetical protein